MDASTSSRVRLANFSREERYSAALRNLPLTLPATGSCARLSIECHGLSKGLNLFTDAAHLLLASAERGSVACVLHVLK